MLKTLIVHPDTAPTFVADLVLYSTVLVEGLKGKSGEIPALSP
jgi:hypothetical protein